MNHRPSLLLAAALVAAGLPVSAQYDPPGDPGNPGDPGGGEHVVDVRDNVFDPPTITIQAGETVTWRWVGPGGFHNVREDGGAFRCANGCDGSGGNGNVSTGWTFSLKFDQTGTVRYYCEAHGGPNGFGMSGRVVVEGSSGGGEPGTLKLGASSYAVGEAAGNASVSVTRTGGTGGAVSVGLSTSPGSAAAGQDYTAVTRTLSWADGDGAPKSASIPIVNDSTTEADETFTVALAGATGGAAIGSPSTATVTIRDDDVRQEPGTISFESGSFGVIEGTARASLSVVRTGGTFGQVSATYQTSDGTATAGADYETSSGTVQFPNGGRRAVITIPIVQDATAEPTETARVSLAGPAGGASLGAVRTATLVIFDEDEAQSSLRADEVVCDAFRLQGFLDRVELRAPHSNETLGVNLSFTRLGDFFGMAYTGNGPASPEAQLAFSTNPEETTLLRNPARPQLFAVSLTRNQTNSDLVQVGHTDQLSLFLNPTLEVESPAAEGLLEVNDMGDPVTRDGGTPAQSKPGRGLAELVRPCHLKLTSRDRHVFQVLAKIARAEMPGAAVVKIGIFRGRGANTYRLDASSEGPDGRSMGRLSAELEVRLGGGDSLDGGTLRLLAECTPDVSTECTSAPAGARLQLIRPGSSGEPWEDSAYFLSTGPGGQATVEVDFGDLLGETTWQRPL